MTPSTHHPLPTVRGNHCRPVRSGQRVAQLAYCQQTQCPQFIKNAQSTDMKVRQVKLNSHLHAYKPNQQKKEHSNTHTHTNNYSLKLHQTPNTYTHTHTYCIRKFKIITWQTRVQISQIASSPSHHSSKQTTI